MPPPRRWTSRGGGGAVPARAHISASQLDRAAARPSRRHGLLRARRELPAQRGAPPPPRRAAPRPPPRLCPRRLSRRRSPAAALSAAQVLVNALANSRTFQRFAIRSNEHFVEAAKKAEAHKATLAEALAEKGEAGGAFFAAFREEMKKGLDGVAGKPPPGRR